MRLRLPSRIDVRALLVLVCAVGASAQVCRAAESIERARRGDFPSSLHSLADEADATFLARYEPNPVTMMMFDLAHRETDFAARRYVITSHASAIDGLLVESKRPGQQARVERILRQLARVAQSVDAEVLLGEAMERELARPDASPSERARAIRNTVAIAELPIAFADSVGNIAAALRIAHDPQAQQAARAVAAAANRRAATIEPDNPWNWIALAWLEDGDAGLLAAKTAAMLPAIENDPDATVAVTLRAAHLQLVKKQPQKAENLLRHGLKTAIDKMKRSNDPDDVRQATIVADALGDLHHATHDEAEAMKAYRWSLDAREQRVATTGRSTASLVDLLAVYERLSLLPQSGNAIAHNDAFSKAFDLDAEIRTRSPFTPMLGPAIWSVMVDEATVIGTVLTLAMGLVVLALYRMRVGSLMKAASSAGGASEIAPSAPPIAAPASNPAITTNPSRSRARATIAMRWTLCVQSAAALAFATVAAWLLISFGDIEPSVRRFIILTTPWTWPLVFVFAYLLAGDSKRLWIAIGAYFAIVALEALWIGLGSTQPRLIAGHLAPGAMQVIFIWLSFSASTVLLLLFLNRSVRAIGPIVMVFMLVTSLGGVFAMVGGSTWFGMRTRIAIENALHIGSQHDTALEYCIGMLVFAPLAWLLVAGLRRLYRARWISDQSLVIDAIWLMESMSLILQYLVFDVGAFAWTGFATFVAYKVVALTGMKIAAHLRDKRPPARLLALRVFGFQRRTERFFDALAMRWRFIGPIQVVAAPDLAGKTIDPEELMDFLSGRLRRRFIIEHADLEKRLATIDERADAFGLYRINDFFCGKDTWRATVEALMLRSDMVVMDLRGFSSTSLGCIYEIEALQNIVRADRIVMLTDKTTNEALLRTTIAACGERLVASSPNRGGSEAIELLRVDGSDIEAIDALLMMADERLADYRKPIDNQGTSATTINPISNATR